MLPKTFRNRARSTRFNFIRPIPAILNPERTKKFRPSIRKTHFGLDFSLPSLFSVSSVLKPLTSFFRTQNLNTENTEKYENAEREAAVTG